MSRPLKLRKTSGYYLRKRVPRDLVAVEGRSEIWLSLRTKDPALAKERHAEEERRLELRWRALRAKPEPLPHQQIVALSGKLYRRVMDMMEPEPGEPLIWHHILRICKEVEGSPDALGKWYGSLADDLLLGEGLATDAYSRTRLIEETYRAHRQAAEQQLKRAEGDYRPDPNADRFPPLSASAKKAAKVSIRDLFELWKRDHLADGKSPGTPGDHQHKIENFIKFIGHDDASRVTPEDVSRWTEHLRHEKGLSAKTVGGKYHSALRAVFGVGVAKLKIERSPVAAVRVKIPKARRERPPGFTIVEAHQILSAALAAPTMPGKETRLNKLACRWVPWICAYTGARGGEITQLRGQDFDKEDGIPFIRIAPDSEDGLTVKTGQFRIVPLHPHLIEQGLLEFVRSRGDGPLFYTPNSRPRKAGTSQAANVRGKVGEWVRNAVGITDPRLQPNHAWRHRFSTVARDRDIPPEFARAIQGHADGSAAAGYGEFSVRASPSPATWRAARRSCCRRAAAPSRRRTCWRAAASQRRCGFSAKAMRARMRAPSPRCGRAGISAFWCRRRSRPACCWTMRRQWPWRISLSH